MSSSRRKFDSYAASRSSVAKNANGGVSKGAVIAIGVIAGVAVVLAIVFAILYATSGTTYIKISNDSFGNKPATSAAQVNQKGKTSAAHVDSGVRQPIPVDSVVVAANTSPVVPPMAVQPVPVQPVVSACGTLGFAGQPVTPAQYQNALNTAHQSEEAAIQAGNPNGVPVHKVTGDDVRAYVNTGVGPLMLASDSPQLMSATNSEIRAAPASADFDDYSAKIRRFDPEGAAISEKALQIAAPDRFFYSEAQESATRKAATIQNMYLAGAADPTVEDVLASTAPIVGTKALFHKAMRAQNEINNTVVLPTPMRFFNDPAPGIRPALPIQLSPIPIEFNVPPGYEFAFTQAQCSEQNKPIRFEGY